MPTPAQLEKINQLAKRTITKEELFVFPCKLAGDMVIPNRHMQLHKTLLDVFRDDARKGVAFMLDHPWAGFFARPKAAYSYGRTFDAVIRRSDTEGEKWALYADTYIVRGREKDGISTDQIINDIEDGVLFDTSIGWGADTYECSICGNDYRNSSKCSHYAGMTYDDELCYIIAKPPGFLMENSGVFDGAYPTAGILAADGSVSMDTDLLIVDDLKSIRTGTPLMNTYSSSKNRLMTFIKKEDIGKKVFAQSALPIIDLKDEGRSGDMEVLQKLGLDPEQVESIDEKGISLKDGSQYSLVKADEIPSTEEKFDSGIIDALEQEKEALKAENESLKSLAVDGKTYRQDLIEEAIEWGVRAQGDKFNKETWKELLSEEGRKLDTIKSFKEQFKEQAKEEIATGKTTKTHQESPVSQLDDRAFKI